MLLFSKNMISAQVYCFIHSDTLTVL